MAILLTETPLVTCRASFFVSATETLTLRYDNHADTLSDPVRYRIGAPIRIDVDGTERAGVVTAITREVGQVDNNGLLRTNLFIDVNTSVAAMGLYATANTAKCVYTTATDSNYQFCVQPTKAEMMREKIRANMSGIRMPYKYLNIVKESDPEAKARGLLREMIGDVAFRNYVTRGFILVKGRSGLLYKIQRQHGASAIQTMAKTKDGSMKPYENICIVFQDSKLPETDVVIMRMLLCMHDEFGLRSMANVWPASRDVDFELSDIAKSLPCKSGFADRLNLMANNFVIANPEIYLAPARRAG